MGGGDERHPGENKRASRRVIPAELVKKVNSHGTVPDMSFVLSEALPVIPAKLVKKVEKGEFVDMEDFLKVRWKGGGWLGETSVAITGQINRREVPDILSWLHSFCSYAAILSEKFPSKTKELWAYTALPFGLRSAPKIFSTVADGLQYMLKKEGVTCFHYLDDFFLAGQGGTDECSTVLTTALECCNELGVPVAPTKNSGAYNKACFLGD